MVLGHKTVSSTPRHDLIISYSSQHAGNGTEAAYGQKTPK